MDFQKAFTFQFDDPDWMKKIGIIALVNLIPIIGQFVTLGWTLEITRRVIRKRPNLLPDLDFGTDVVTGLKSWVVSFLYYLPVIILYIPIMILMIGADNSNNTTLAVILSIFVVALMVAYSLVIGFVLPAALARLANTGEIREALRVGEVFKMVVNNPVAYLIVLAGIIVAGIISSLGTILCVVGVALTAAYGASIMGFLYGQAYLASAPADPTYPVPSPSNGFGNM